ncbi:hypothetical protein QRQ56_38875 [Bradyrhizobium sp. U531]|uniref:hypothetical protein n=1 Tax=Bradyrhizobium sp. U531 TaxID=3053458 RepID=UPI003F437134
MGVSQAFRGLAACGWFKRKRVGAPTYRMMFDVRLSENLLVICLPGAHVREHTSDTKNFEVIRATPERLAVIPGRSDRTWSREAKGRIVKKKGF